VSGVTHIFFNLIGTLVDSRQFQPCYSSHLGQVLAARYGKAPDDWVRAHESIAADWDSYYADLDLTGDDGMDHYWEGMLRTTRALFRLTRADEPDLPTVTQLARHLPALAAEGCDALYDDVRPTTAQLGAAGFRLGIASPALSTQARALLHSGGVLAHFSGTILAPDTAGQFGHDAQFYRLAAHLTGVEPDRCLVVDHLHAHLHAAHTAGMHTVLIDRQGSHPSAAAAVDFVCGSLAALPTWLARSGDA
jgi:FMN phosphatase YigB (HAD superfamily)